MVRAACRPPPCGRGWTGASADGIDFPTLVQRAGIAFASLKRFAEGVGRCYAVKRRRTVMRFIESHDDRPVHTAHTPCWVALAAAACMSQQLITNKLHNVRK